MDNIKTPHAQAREHIKELHGIKWNDPFFWLQDRDDPQVMKYISEENAYADSVMKPCEKFGRELFAEIKSRYDENEISAPVKNGAYLYYLKYQEGLPYPIYCRKKEQNAPEEILLNQNLLAEGHDFCSVSSIKISDKTNQMIYGVDFSGNEIFEIRVKKLSSSSEEILPIQASSGDFEWAADGKSFFYTTMDESHRPCELFHHTQGQDCERDVRLCSQDDPEYGLYIETSKSKKYLFIIMSAIETAYSYCIPLDKPFEDMMQLSCRKKGVECLPYHAGSNFYFRTNENAYNFKITVASESSLSEVHDFIPHDENIFIEDFEVFKSFAAVKERQDGAVRIKTVSYDLLNASEIELPDKYGNVNFAGNREFDSDTVRFSSESLAAPVAIYEYAFSDCLLRQIWQRKSIGYDKSKYITERKFVPSHDGTMVPLTCLYRKDKFTEGKSPCFLMGYGAYGYSYDPSFSNEWISLADRGFMCAIAHIRGGEEMGRKWYFDGKFLNKKNTFLDFIACGEYLKKSGLAGKTAAYGRSAGGLLAGAVMTMRPDLFDVVCAEVPFVDTLNTMLDEALPLTVGEYNEWGNPNDRKFFEYISSYSPYDNISEEKYPPLYLFSALNDTRVMYWEPLKFMAKFRQMNKGTNSAILRLDCSCGHSGSSGRYDRIKEKAFLYSYVFLALNCIADNQ